MSVYDRWHLSHPENHPGWNHPDPAKRLEPCRCGRGRNKLYPSADHGCARRWQVRYRDDTGRQVKANFAERYGDDPDRHAEALDKKVGADLDTGNYTSPKLGKTTLQEYARQWRAGLTVDPSTLLIIDQRLAHIYDVTPSARTRRAPGSSVIGPLTMERLAKRPSILKQWIKGLQAKGLAPGYIKDIFNTLSSIFIAAMDDGVISKNPTKAQSVTLPTVDKKVIEPWTREMASAARDSLEAEIESGAMIDLGVGAGLRQGEIFGVAEDDIVFLGRRQDRKIRVRRQIKLLRSQETGEWVPVFAPPKGGKERDVPLADALGRRLSAHIKAHPPVEVTLPWKTPDSKKRVTVRLLFVRGDGKPWTRKRFIYHWHKTRRAAGAAATRENGMHVLRHTYASVTLANGVDVLKLAAWLGHDDPGFTLRTYTHFVPDLADRGRAAVDDFLEPEAGSDVGSSALDVPSEGE